MLIVYLKIKNKQLKLTCSFETYFLKICYYRLKNIYNKRLTEQNHVYYYLHEIYNPVVQSDYKNTEQYSLFMKHFNSLNDKNQTILKLYFDKASMGEIAEELGYNCSNTSKNTKYRCIKKLMVAIQSDPAYYKLKF